MFKSKFANALTTMMIGSLGLAAAENKLSVGYGAEAGPHGPARSAKCARVIAGTRWSLRAMRSRARILRELGVPTELGTDTAWTFEPLPPEYGQKILRQVGWDGTTPVLVVCPINPFEWPVKASVAKFALRTLTGAYKDSHYRSVYFHNSGAGGRPRLGALPRPRSPMRSMRSASGARFSSSWWQPSGWMRGRRAESPKNWAAFLCSPPTITTCTNW